MRTSMSDSLGRRYSTTRFAMYNAVEEYIRMARLDGRVLMISEGTEPAIRRMFPPTASCTATSYPPIDVADLSMFPDASFECVVTDQVLEHVRQPWRALSEMRRVLVPGGVAINTSCAFNPVHDACDYFRFMPDGFRALHEDFIGRVELHGAWGNRESIGRFVTEGTKSFDVRGTMELTERATRVEPAWPWVVWCAARTPEGEDHP
jgi:SAM-dependent methyltransferase